MFPKTVSKSPANKNTYFKRDLNTKSNLCIICTSPIVTTSVCIKGSVRWEI